MKHFGSKSIFLLLLLTTIPGIALTKPWKGVEVISRDTFKYGAFEARIRAAEGSGLVTAFFLWKDGSEVRGTEWQEQDIEIFGKNGRFQTQIMTPGDPRTPHSVRHRLSTNAWENYYTYRMEWTPEYLAFYVDNHLIRKETNASEYGKLLDPQRAEAAQLRINIWAGDWSWSGEFDESKTPGYTYVDYIEVYDYTPGTGQGDFTSRWRDDFNSLESNRWWFANWTFDRAINDFIPANAATRNGKLVLALTGENQTAQFPTTAPNDNPPLPPVDAPVYTSLPEDIEPFSTPARIEAEWFHAYYDDSPGNNGHEECDTHDVDAQLTADEDGHCNIAWTRRGEYLTYWVRIPDSEEYTFRIRASSAHADRVFHVESDGEDISGPLTVEALGWQAYQDIEFTVPMVDGIREISLVFDTGSVNVNYLVIDSAIDPVNPDPAEPPPEEPQLPEEPEIPEEPNGPQSLPGRIEAESFTDFVDFTTGNEGSAACGSGDVDMELTNDQNGGCNIGWTESGEYTEYWIHSAEAQNYAVTLRLASDYEDQYILLEVDGEVQSTPFYAPNNGWQNFSDVTANVLLEAGEHRVRVLYETGLTNFNYMLWEATDIPIDEEQTPSECEPSRYEAEEMNHSTGGEYPGGWNIWTDGHISTDHAFAGGEVDLSVIARADLAGDEAPRMQLRIAGNVVGEVEVASEEYRRYDFSISQSQGAKTVEVAFTNDFLSGDQDRNLRIDYIMIDSCPQDR